MTEYQKLKHNNNFPNKVRISETIKQMNLDINFGRFPIPNLPAFVTKVSTIDRSDF